MAPHTAGSLFDPDFSASEEKNKNQRTVWQQDQDSTNWPRSEHEPWLLWDQPPDSYLKLANIEPVFWSQVLNGK